MGMNPFFITHGYNTPLLDYDIAAAAGTKNRGARTPVEIRNCDGVNRHIDILLLG